MKLNRLTVLVTILIVVSVGTNIFTLWDSGTFIPPTELKYKYTKMFENSVLLYRPAGTNGMAMLNMDGAVVTISEFGPPMNCAVLNIHTADGMIPGACVAGVLNE
jgi:hypothetical protein